MDDKDLKIQTRVDDELDSETDLFFDQEKNQKAIEDLKMNLGDTASIIKKLKIKEEEELAMTELEKNKRGRGRGNTLETSPLIVLPHTEGEAKLKKILIDLINGRQRKYLELVPYVYTTEYEATRRLKAISGIKDIMCDSLMFWLNAFDYDLKFIKQNSRVPLDSVGDSPEDNQVVTFNISEKFGDMKKTLAMLLNSQKITLGNIKATFKDSINTSNKIISFNKSADLNTTTLLQWCELADLGIEIVDRLG